MKEKKVKPVAQVPGKHGGLRPGAGRPGRVVPWEEVQHFASIHATADEIAGALGIARKTLFVHCLEENGCALGEYLDRYASPRKIALRRLQFETANGGQVAVAKTITHKDGSVEKQETYLPPNPALQIWLGKQYLGQVDKVEVPHSGEITLRIVEDGSTTPAQSNDNQKLA